MFDLSSTPLSSYDSLKDSLATDNPFSIQDVNTPDSGIAGSVVGKFLSDAASVLDLSLPQGMAFEPYGPNLPDTTLTNQVGGTVTNNQSITIANQVARSFQSNVLDSYDNVTYYFKLSWAREDQLTDPEAVPTGPFYVIAETGVTAEFYLQNVEINNVVSANAQTKNTHSTVINMTIVEPQGVSFIDKMLAAAKALGIQSPKTCPLFLELSFKGYSVDGVPTEVSIAKRWWKIIIADIATSVDTGGSSYRITAPVMGEYAFNRFSAAAIIKQPIHLELSTVGRFFDDLSNTLTAQSKSISENGSQEITSDVYKFVVAPEMRDWVVGVNSDTPNTPSMFIDVDGKRTASFNTDVAIDVIVDNILASTKEGQQMVNPSGQPESISGNPVPPKVCKIAKVTGKVKHLDFNAAANDYNKEYTYYITKFDVYRILLDDPTSDDSNRYQYMVRDAMKKKYSYLFTGNNLDVLNLDLNFETLWQHSTIYYANALQRKNAITQSKYGSNQHQYSQVSSPDDLRAKLDNPFSINPKLKADPVVDLLKPTLPTNFTPIPKVLPSLSNIDISAADKLASNVSSQSSQLSQTVNSFTSQINQVPAQNLPDVVKTQMLADNKLLNGDLLSFINRPISGLPAGVSNTPIDVCTAGSPTGVPLLSGAFSRISGTDDPSSTGNKATNDILIETLPTSNLLDNSLSSYITKQVDTQIDTTRYTKHIEDSIELGRSIFSVVTNQLYASGVDANLIKIDMEIRGDPFWLGETETEVFSRLSGVMNIHGSDEYANYLKGENCFFLTFNTPSKYDENTGFVPVSKADIWVGIYAVQKVTSTFADGKFTQKLMAIRDIQTDVEKLSQYIR